MLIILVSVARLCFLVLIVEIFVQIAVVIPIIMERIEKYRFMQVQFVLGRNIFILRISVYLHI